MKRIFLAFLFVSLILGKEIDLSKKIYLQKEIEIGVSEGDSELMFAVIGEVWIDEKGNIYIGDPKSHRIQVFDKDGKFKISLNFQKGEGPGEVQTFTSFFIFEPDLLVVQQSFKPKISIFRIERGLKFLRDINLDFSQSLKAIAPEKNNSICIAGLRHEKIFHIYDINGNYLRSFGEPFKVPSHLSRFKDIPFLRAPWGINYSKGKIFVFNPHKYELLIFQDDRLIQRIREDIPYSPLQITKTNIEGGVGFFFENPVVLSHEKTIYVWRIFDFYKEEAKLDIFIDFKYKGSISVGKTRLKAIDSKGRLYFSEEEEYPKLIVYKVRER